MLDIDFRSGEGGSLARATLACEACDITTTSDLTGLNRDPNNAQSSWQDDSHYRLVLPLPNKEEFPKAWERSGTMLSSLPKSQVDSVWVQAKAQDKILMQLAQSDMSAEEKKEVWEETQELQEKIEALKAAIKGGDKVDLFLIAYDQSASYEGSVECVPLTGVSAGDETTASPEEAKRFIHWLR